MHTENERAEAGIEGLKESADEAQEENLSWLLDMDRSEPEEGLFKLEDDDFQDQGLTEYETELATRPLSRTGSAADDISSIVAEEIVVSSEGSNVNMFGEDTAAAANTGDDAPQASAGKYKAIDHSRKKTSTPNASVAPIEEGSDILGLAEDDDMGEKFLSLKRVKTTVSPANESNGSSQLTAAPLEISSLQDESHADQSEIAALSPGLGVSEVPDAVAEQEAGFDLSSGDDGDLDDFGWLAEDVQLADLPDLGNVEEELNEVDSIRAEDLEIVEAGAKLSSDQPELPGANEWLGDLSLDLADVGAQLSDGKGEQIESNEWLGDVELELEEKSEEPPVEATSAPEFDDWLGDVELELADTDSDKPAESDWLDQPSDLELTEMFDSDDADSAVPGISDVVSEEWLAGEEIESEPDVVSEAWLAGEEIESEPDVVSEAWLAGEEIESEPDELTFGALESELSDTDGWLSDGDSTLGSMSLAGSESDEAADAAAGQQSELDVASALSSEREPLVIASEDSAQTTAESDKIGQAAIEMSLAGEDATDEAATAQDAGDLSAQQVAEQPADAAVDKYVAPSEPTATEFIAGQGDRVVANDDPLDEIIGEAGEIAEVESDSVIDYVAQHQAPLDDTEFDEYLLRGAHLQESTPDLDELEVEHTEGMASVDPNAEVEIDYHEDFHALEGLEQTSIVAITSVISGVMEEISGLARARAEQTGVAGSTIEVDVMLGSDPESIKQCCAEGFAPVASVVPELPVALSGLGEAEIGSIYVRLFNGQTNESCNDLFSEDLLPADTMLDVGSDESPALANAPTDSAAPSAEQSLDAIFGDELFSDESLDSLENTGLAESMEDIESHFDGFGDLDDDEILSRAEPEVDSFDSDVFDFVEEETMAEMPAVDASEVEASFAPEVTAEASMPGDDMRAAETPEASGFSDDIFDTELSGELSDDAAGDAADIDTIFAGLEMDGVDTGAICGLDVDEFAETSDSEALVAVSEITDTGSVGLTEISDDDLAWCVPAGIAFDRSSESGNEIFADFLDAFIEEGAATIEKLEDAVGDWERDIASEAAYVPVGRILHTLKGIAKGVGLQRYGTLIHNYETLLEGMPRPEPGEDADYFRIVNAWLDAAVRGLEFVRENRIDVASELPVQLVNNAAAVESAAAQSDQDGVEEVTDDAMSRLGVSQAVAARQKKRDQQLADDGAKALAAQQSVRITSEKLDHLLNLTNQAQQLGVRSAQSSNRSKRASAELQARLSSVRSHIAKIADRALLNVTARGGEQPSSEMDALEMDQYSELQEAANILREAVEDLADLVDVSSRHTAVLESQLKQQATVISSIGSSIQAARVVPVSRLMPGLRRIIRTVSADLDKSVAFKVLNETGALDRDHYARCQVILEHMVRNALDHGIESPEERLAAGKATTGRISIDVRKSGGDYFITLADDGRGIDPYEMRESAFRKGLDIDVDALSDEEAIKLIFHKGFSTASSVSEISGRGVGMDIVLNELQQIGGDVQVQSKVGHGTTFEVHIPANVTVNGALFVTAGEGSFAIPLHGLVAVEHVPVEDFFEAVETGKTLRLFDMDCDPAYLATLCHGESLPDRDAWGETVPVIIAGSEKRYMAIAIDHVKEALELVIRSLGPQFANVPGVAGGATTADGEAIVALDLNVLVESVVAGNLSPVSVERSKDKTLLALVVDDSRTQRMVTTSQFDTVGVETVTAENGLVAIDLLNTTHRLPDVVLLDVEMPVKDGIETLKEIRKSARYKDLPVIMVTSRTGAKHRALAEEAGCNGYMGKPFNFPGLIEQINELTGYDLQVS